MYFTGDRCRVKTGILTCTVFARFSCCAESGPTILANMNSASMAKFYLLPNLTVIYHDQKEIFQRVPGILRQFKEFVESKGLKNGDQIVDYGVPGTCTLLSNCWGLPSVPLNSNRSSFP